MTIPISTLTTKKQKMKRTISTIVLLFALAVSSLAQTVPQIYYPDGYDYEMIVLNTSDFGQGQFGSDPA